MVVSLGFMGDCLWWNANNMALIETCCTRKRKKKDVKETSFHNPVLSSWVALFWIFFQSKQINKQPNKQQIRMGWWIFISTSPIQQLQWWYVEDSVVSVLWLLSKGILGKIYENREVKKQDQKWSELNVTVFHSIFTGTLQHFFHRVLLYQICPNVCNLYRSQTSESR